MTSCDSCGGSVDADETVCPYCGSSIRKQAETATDDTIYHVRQDADGLTHVSFGDGISGRKLSTGTGIQTGYRRGAGSSGNIAAELVMKLDELYHQIKKVPNAKKGGSKDAGAILLEALASMSDILSVYQEGISKETHLDTDDRKRLSKMEKRVTSKLKGLVRFCEKVSPRALGQLGVSNSDISKMENIAIKTLKMTRYSVCTKCGTMNRPDIMRCQKCGRKLK